MQTWDLGSRFHTGFPFYLNAYRNVLWVLPICLLVTLKTLAVTCTSHQSPPLIHSELVLDSRWAKMCSNQPAAPRRLWLLPSQAQEPLITCTAVGIGPALETKGWQVLSSPRFGKAVSDFFWNLPGSLRLSASSPSENYLCLIACNYSTAPEDVQATSGVTPLSSHRRSWHVILGPMEQASELNKWSGREAGFSDGLNLTVKIEARTAKLTWGAGWHHRKPFRWACCRMKVSLWGEQVVDALSVRPYLCLRPREGWRVGELGTLLGRAGFTMTICSQPFHSYSLKRHLYYLSRHQWESSMVEYVFSLCLFLHCCPVNKFFSTICLYSVYVC